MNNIISPASIKKIKPIIFLLALLPFILLVYRFFSGLIIDPIEEIHETSGQWAMRFLLLSLCISPLRKFTNTAALILIRRMIGLFALFYASIHILNYLFLDRNLDWMEIIIDVTERPYIIVGLVAFIILAILGITSPKRMIKKLGGRLWQKVHYMVYLAGLLACIHYLWLVKTVTTLSVMYLLAFIILMTFRLKTKR